MDGVRKETVGKRTVVSVLLGCVSCGKVEEIHVFPERGLPNRLYWECLDCQKHNAPGVPRPDARPSS